MPQSLKWPLLLAGLIALAACDLPLPSVAGEGRLRADVDAPVTEVTVGKPIEQVWNDLALIALSNSYRIDELNKEAGFIQLGFGRPASSFIRCNASLNGEGLSGTMIVQVKAVADGRTEVKVKSHYSYVATTMIRGSRIWRFRTGESRTITDVTGGRGRYPYSGGPVRTTRYRCNPTHLAERTIVDGIREKKILAGLTPTQGLDLARDFVRAGDEFERHSPEFADQLRGRSQAIYASVCMRAAALEDDPLGLEPIDGLAARLNVLGNDCASGHRYADAEVLYKRAIAASEAAFGPDHLVTAAVLDDLAALYRERQRYPEAQSIYERALAIREEAYGVGNPRIGQTLDRLAGSYLDQGKIAEAEALYIRALAAQEKALGISHPVVDQTLKKLEKLYRDQGMEAKIEGLYKRWELSSPYCYRPAANSMLRVYLMDCPPNTVFATRSEHAEWKESKEDYREKFRARQAAE